MSFWSIQKAVAGSQWILTLPLKQLGAWWRRKSPRDVLLENLQEARLFEEWEAAAFQLDELLGYDLWYGVFSFRRRRNTLVLTTSGARLLQTNTLIIGSFTRDYRPLLRHG